ncbi:MAG TPA: hypothetical protein VJH69_00265 [Candidatus Paceibacterota bacterium]
MNIRARNLLFAQFGVIAIVGGLHIVGTVNFLYWRLPWFDLVTHVLGGLWAGLFAAWILALKNKLPRMIFCVAATFLLGIIWESFEATNGIINLPKESLDTTKDLLMDTVGGLLAFYVARKITH